MRSFLKAYKHVLVKHPAKLQALQTGFLMGLGDVIAQTAIENKNFKNVDIMRTTRFFGIGFCIAVCFLVLNSFCRALGPGLKIWYGFLDKYVGRRKTGAAVALKKVLVDQAIFAPNFLASFIVLVGVLQNDSSSKIRENFRCHYYDILIANYKVWPTVQLVNFYVMPLQYQVLFVQVVALFWNTYLSWKTSKPAEKSFMN